MDQTSTSPALSSMDEAENKEQRPQSSPKTKREEDVLQLTVVKATHAFWQAWLNGTSIHVAAINGHSTDTVEISNALWIVQCAFRGYLATQEQKGSRLCLIATWLPEKRAVHLRAGDPFLLNTAEFINNQTIKDYWSRPIDERYYLLIFVKNPVVLVFRKRLYANPYMLTGDVHNALAFLDQHGDDPEDPPWNSILQDDE